jgi:hypothetical protein
MDAINSKILDKNYKTLSGYKSALTRYTDSLNTELNDRLKSKIKGNSLYLGENIDVQIYSIQNELHEARIELKLNIKKYGTQNKMAKRPIIRHRYIANPKQKAMLLDVSNSQTIKCQVI